MWSPATSLSDQTLSSAPVWLSLLNVPPPLWSVEGFELIASGVGVPLPSTSTSAPPFGTSPPRVRVVVPLTKGPLPLTVLVEDDLGCQVSVELRYTNLPPLCPSCSLYGHRIHRCPKRSSHSPSHIPDAASAPPTVPPAATKESHQSTTPSPRDTNSTTTPSPDFAAVTPFSPSRPRPSDTTQHVPPHQASSPLPTSGPGDGPLICPPLLAKSRSKAVTKPTNLLDPNSLQFMVMGHKAHPDPPSPPISLEPTSLAHLPSPVTPGALRPLSLRPQTPTKLPQPPTSDASPLVNPVVPSSTSISSYHPPSPPITQSSLLPPPPNSLPPSTSSPHPAATRSPLSLSPSKSTSSMPPSALPGPSSASLPPNSPTSASPLSSEHHPSPHRLPLYPPLPASFTSLLIQQQMSSPSSDPPRIDPPTSLPPRTSLLPSPLNPFSALDPLFDFAPPSS